MIKHFLAFEKQIADLEGKIEELRHLSSGSDINIAEEIGKLQASVSEKLKSTYSQLSPWQKVLVSRHPERPHFQDIIKNLFEDYIPLSGDRNFSDDSALTGGTAFFRGRSVIAIGIDKGKNTQDRINKNFGMARPEGYRKAERLMELANKFSMPVLMFVDTAGAYPGKGAEQRGQAEAIAKCTQKSLEINVPSISIITGEGGSGGAVALAVANNTLMLEHAIYSVISPEGCASILWRDPSKSLQAAEAMKLTAKDLLKLKVIDEIIPEPLGGAHRDPENIAADIKHSIIKNLKSFENLSKEEIYDHRKAKFLQIGRERGFAKSSNLEGGGLSYKEANVRKIVSHIEKNKLFYAGIALLLVTSLITLLF